MRFWPWLLVGVLIVAMAFAARVALQIDARDDAAILQR